MFFEKIGKLFFSKIHPAIFFLLVTLPLIAALCIVYIQYTDFHELQERYLRACRKETISSEKKGRKERFCSRFSHTNAQFLEEIETYPLLSQEKEQIEATLRHPAFPKHAAFKDRLKWIENNHLSFFEKDLRNVGNIKETVEVQKQPVQMSESDLQRLLSLLENVKVGGFSPSLDSPQILITDLQIRRQKSPLQTGMFEVEMQLLKREFTQ